MEGKECRICFEKDKVNEFINPCLCNGTSKWVHKSCLNQWIEINIHKPANTTCMECKYTYKFNYLYPEEKFLLKKYYIYKYRLNYLIMLFIGLVPTSYILFALDKSNDYLYIKLISYNKEIYNKTKFIIKNDSFYNTVIYNTLSLTVYMNIYMFLFLRYTLKKKKRKFLYFIQIYKILLVMFITINNPFYVYYFFMIFEMYTSYIISQILLSFYTIFMTINIIRTHNKIVNRMNKEFNKKLILNYEHLSIENVI